MSARPNVLPFERRSMPHAFQVTAVDAAGDRHTWGITAHTQAEADRRAIDLAHGAGLHGIRLLRARVVRTEQPTDFGDWADTVAPHQADEASERLTSQASPFDALPPHDTDEAWPHPGAEDLAHRISARLLAIDRAQLWARRPGAMHADLLDLRTGMLNREARRRLDAEAAAAVREAQTPAPTAATATDAAPPRPAWLHPIARRHLPHALALAGLGALFGAVITAAVFSRAGGWL